MEEKDCYAEDVCELPVAQEVINDECNIVIADIITINNLDNRYILIYKNSKKINILIVVQGTLNLILTILLHYWYLLLTILCYTGYYGVINYKYKYIMAYNIYLLIDLCYHVTSFIYTFKETYFVENGLNFLLVCIYLWILSITKNHIKSIKNLTEDEILLLKNIK